MLVWFLSPIVIFEMCEYVLAVVSNGGTQP